MKYPFYSGLSGKTAIIFLAGFLLIILPINIFVYNKLKTTIITADNQQLNAEALKLTAQIKLDPVVIPLAPAGYSIHVQVFNGQFLHSLFFSPDFPRLSDELYYLETVDLDTLKVLTRRSNIEGGNGELLVSIAQSNRRLNEQLSEFRGYLFYLAGTAIAVMVILVFSLSEVMFRPLKNVITIAEKINASKSINKIPVPAVHDETKLLAITLNNMLIRIENSLNTQLQFFDSATHELKTPLAIMKAQLSVALENTEDSYIRKTLQSILEEGSRLERTISDFLLLSQLKTNNLLLRMESSDLSELLFSKLPGIKKFAEQRNISFQIQQTETLFPVKVDKDKIQTVIFNLLENAVYHSADGSTVKIHLAKNDHSILLRVKNTISNPIENPEKLGKERYTRSSTSRGMGLGLWICNQIMAMHSGELIITPSDLEFEVEIQLHGLN